MTASNEARDELRNLLSQYHAKVRLLQMDDEEDKIPHVTDLLKKAEAIDEWLIEQLDQYAREQRIDELNKAFGKDSPKDTDDWYSVPVEYLSKRLDELSDPGNTQQDLIDFVTDPEAIKKAVEGSMEKRQALIDRVDSGNSEQPKGDSNE